MNYAYTTKQGIMYFKRLNFMLCVLKKKKMTSPVCFPTGSSPRALEGLCWGDLSVSFLQTSHRHGAPGEADAPLRDV